MANTTIPVELSSTPGIVDNSNATAITIDSSENVGIGVVPSSPLHVNVGTNQNLEIDSASSELRLSAVNDARSANPAIRFQAESYKFYGSGGVGPRATIDSSGKVGIGTASVPANRTLQVSSSDVVPIEAISSGGETIISLDNTATNGRNYFLISGGTAGTYAGGKFGIFDADAAADRMSIDSSGNVTFNEGSVDADFRVESDGFSSALSVEGSSGKVNVAAHFGIGKTSGGESQASGSGFFFVPGVNGYYSHLSTVDTANFSSYFNRKTQTGGFFNFAVNDAGVGSVTYNGSATVYGTLSDERLKENIADADDAGSKIDAMQVRKFDWKRNGHHQEYGMVAQELLLISPDSIAQGDTEEDMMGVDYSTLVPMLIKEIQSLRARVADLES